jgi:hypothetical protein
MQKSIVRILVPLLAAGLLSSCDKSDERADSGSPPGQPGDRVPDPDRCIEGRAILVGDTDVVMMLEGTKLHWDTSGTVLKLARNQSGKEVELVASTYLGGPSLPKGDCLRSGGYIRFADANRTGNDRYLQAFQQADPDNVLIGNYPDPQIDSIFNIVKDPEASGNSVGAIIRRGDIVHVRGVSRDPWLRAPNNATEGSEVGLVNWDQFGQATPWKIIRRGDPE